MATNTVRLTAAIWMGCIAMALPWYASAQTDAREALRKGNRAYQKGAYDAAEQAYQSGSQSPQWEAMRSFNLGDALYRQERYAEAEKAYTEALKHTDDRQLRAKALHNLGNARYQQKNYKGAAEGYAESLKLQPGDPLAQYNLAQSLRKLGAPPPPPSSAENQPQESPEEKDGDASPQSQGASPESGNPQDQPGSPEKNEPKRGSSGMRPEEVEQLLDALEQEDARVQKKLREDKQPPKQGLDGKNW
ncbi:tetratricopeptide repeat protein [bacterium]|nr:tetratricopeptide repeat protein [bacterium]